MSSNNNIQAAVTNGFLFTAGQRGVDENGRVVSPDVTKQTLKALENLEKVLTDNNSSLEKIQKLTVYYTCSSHFLTCNRAVQKFFTDKKVKIPKCASVETNRLPPEILAEVEATAK